MQTAAVERASVLAVIPARAGSKGIPGKNIRPLAGRPLLQYTVEAAAAAQTIQRAILSTDSEEIAALGRQLAIEVPFLRPADLAQDDSPTAPVILHALDWLEADEGYRPEIVVVLQPTAPLRTGRHIDEAISLLLESDADAVVSVAPVPGHFHPEWQFTVCNGELLRYDETPLSALPARRQRLPVTYTRNGAVYACRCPALQATGSLFGRRALAYVMPPEAAVSLDSELDWRLVEALLGKQSGHQSV